MTTCSISIDTPRKCYRCGHHHCVRCRACHRNCGCRWYIPTTAEQERRWRRIEYLERWVREADL